MAAKDEEKKEEQKEPGSKKKLFIIIGAAVAAVVVVVVVLVLVFSGGSKKGGSAPPAEAKKSGSHGGSGSADTKGGSPTVLPLEPFIVNIYDGQEVRYLKVKIEFEMVTPDVKGDLDAKQAPIRDAILVLLTTKTLQDIQDLQGKNQLREEILAAVNKIIPPGKVTRVYFTDFVVQ